MMYFSLDDHDTLTDIQVSRRPSPADIVRISHALH